MNKLIKAFVLSLFLAACSNVPAGTSQITGALSTPHYIQGAFSTPQSPQSPVSVAFPAAEQAGDLIVVFVGWDDSTTTITSITDTRGNTYSLAVSTKKSGSASQSTYYALNVPAGSNTITVTFNHPAPAVDLRFAEYSGIATFDKAIGASGSSKAPSSGALTGVTSGDLLVAGDLIFTSTTAPGSGWTQRYVTTPDSDLVEDRIASTTGSYTATASMNPTGWWVMQVAAFKASTGTTGTGGQGGSAGTGGQAGGLGGMAGSSAGASGSTGMAGSMAGAAGSNDGGIDSSGGAGGQADGGTGIFPLSYSSNNKYLQDAHGNPFPILGRTAWAVITAPSSAGTELITDSLAKGYNTFEFAAIWDDTRTNNAPFDGAGNVPFLNTLGGSAWSGSMSFNNINTDAPDFSTPNPAYWNSVTGFVDACASNNILVLMFPSYGGYDAELSQGWMQVMVANGPTKMQAYGTYVGNLFASRSNIVWMAGGDEGTSPFPYNSSQTAVETALINGVKSANGRSVFWAAEWQSESIATDQTTFGPEMTINSTYSWTGDVATQGIRAYSYSPAEPAFLMEEPYDQEGPDGDGDNPNATQPVRRFQWWGWLTVIGGYNSGNGYVWPFNGGVWDQHLNTQGAQDMARLNTFIKSIPWYQLVPSGQGIKTLITSGGGSGGSLITAAANIAGTLLVAYVPDAHGGSFNVDMTQMSGQATAKWYNPTTAAYTTIGSFPNTGTPAFTVPGDNGTGFTDWVLVITVP